MVALGKRSLNCVRYWEMGDSRSQNLARFDNGRAGGIQVISVRFSPVALRFGALQHWPRRINSARSARSDGIIIVSTVSQVVLVTGAGRPGFLNSSLSELYKQSGLLCAWGVRYEQ